MPILASPFVDWSALGKILLAGLIGGAGVVILFGFLLLGVKYVNSAKGEGQRVFGYVLAIACGTLCIAAVVLGIYAMTQKKASKPVKTNSKRAWVLPASGRHVS